MKKGFTLIELLVVVLIIGILAAIALPQYRRAVERANLSKYMALVKALADAEQTYFLTNSMYAGDLDDLDISVPVDDSCVRAAANRYDCDWGMAGIMDGTTNAQAGNANMRYLHFFADFNNANLTANKGEIFCFATPGNEYAAAACISIGGTKVSSSAAWDYYKITN